MRPRTRLRLGPAADNIEIDANSMRSAVKLTDDIRPLTDFKRNTSAFVNRMKKTHRPLVLTVNGKAELVVQDARGYQQMLDRLDRLEAVEAIRLGMQAAQEGRVRPAREALAELGAKLAIPR